MKRFDIITEADARLIDRGATVELAKGGHITPLARDTLASRRVTVVPAGADDPTLPNDLAPVAEIRRVAIGNDMLNRVPCSVRLIGFALRARDVDHFMFRCHQARDQVGAHMTTSANYHDAHVYSPPARSQIRI